MLPQQPSIHTLFPKSVKMKELVRDTVFGHFLRLVTGGRVLPYEEDRDPSLWKRYIDVEKSGRMAHHGHTEDEEEDEEEADPAHSSSKEQAVWKAMQQPILAIVQILKLEAAMCNEMK